MKHIGITAVSMAILTVCPVGRSFSSALEGTWELVRTNEIYYQVEHKTDTSLTDTVIVEQPQSEFYRFSRDSVYHYDLDYEDSRESNCYLLWAYPYKLLDDSSLALYDDDEWSDQCDDYGDEVTISFIFRISGDSLRYSELWWEDSPDDIYHQSKHFYFVRRENQLLPPPGWPAVECHSMDEDNEDNILMPERTYRPFSVAPHKGPTLDLLGRKMALNPSRLLIRNGKKEILLTGKRR